MIWKILGIEKTKDEEVIRNAYHEKLHYVNPEDDEEGFKELRSAFEHAMEYAGEPEDETESNNEEVIQGKKTDVDYWIDKIEKIYEDVVTRIDETKWDALLHDSVCDDLDTELEAAEKLLVFFMSHSYMPQNIWQLADKRFHYMDNYDQLKEKFPENYLEYVRWQIENQGFIDFTLFDGKTDDHVDDYINKLYEMKSAYENEEFDRVEQVLKEMKRFDITHPFTDVEEARYYMAKANELEKEADDESKSNEKDPDVTLKIEKYRKDALSIMEDLDFQYCDNSYIERIYADALVENGEAEKACKIYETLLDESPDNYTAAIGQARCVYLMGDPENAKELVEDVMEERVQDRDCLLLLDIINEDLVLQYTKQLEEEMDPAICYKLGWCYYQQKKFKEGIELLDKICDNDEYDYVNLRCRLYLANENYNEAYPLALRWLKMIQETVNDGSRDALKKKNRESLANFSLGICVWENQYKCSLNKTKKQEFFEQGVSYLQKAIEGESNLLVRLSYMEQLARFYLDAGEYERCVSVCSDIINEDRGFFPAYVHRQKANYELKNAKEVIDDFFACKELYPVYVPPYLLAAEVFYAFEQYDDVEHVIESAAEAGIASDTLELYRIRCIHYKEYSRENTEKALKLIRVLREKVDNKPPFDDPDAAEDEKTDIENPAELEREYAIIYWDLDDVQMTMTIINAYLETDPTNTTMLHLKIDVLNREDKEEEALSVCKHLLELEPDNLFTKSKLGNCYERVRKYADAILVYKEILDVNPSYVQAIRRLMYIYSFLSNRERDLDKCRIGIDYATKLIEVTGTAEGYVERGNLYIDLYELDKAVADCKKAIELDPEAYYAYNNLGCALLKLRKVDDAILPLEQVIKMDPERDALPYLNLAECYALKERYEDAIDTYNRIMKIWPKRVGLREEVAILYKKLGNYEKAIELYLSIPDAIIDVYGGAKTDNSYIGNSIEAYCDVLKVYDEMDDYKNAVKHAKKAMSLLAVYSGDHFPDKVDNIIELFRDRSEYKKGEKYGKKLLSIAKKRSYNDKHIVFAYTTLLFDAGKKDEASKYAKYYLKNLFEKEGTEEELLADKRYIPMHSYNLAIMNICMGNMEKACELLGNIPDCKLCVMCVSHDCFEYYFGMGLVAELNGRLQEAKMFYEKAIEIHGYYPCARNHLDKVNKALS